MRLILPSPVSVRAPLPERPTIAGVSGASSGWSLGRDLAIDLGTANTLIWERGKGVVLDEPSVVALEAGTDRLIAAVIGLLSIYVHPLVGWVLVGWFVGGFAYLVLEMPKSPRDPWDDGSRI